ncbi:MAG: hypothetical protein ACREJU_03485 [Nitrospiraceae bacterium]
MTVIRSGMMIFTVAAAFLISACATEESTVPTSSKMTGSATATSARQAPMNPLQECLARIPKDATAGQRSFGELTCQRDHGAGPTDTRRDPQNYASGTQGDTLQTCMSRIPKDATAGQRMIAEDSCKRDESNRRSVDTVPGTR